MKKTLIAATALSALSISAFAADLSSRTKSPSAPIFTWTGSYAGVNAGLASMHSKSDDLGSSLESSWREDGSSTTTNAAGFLVGGQLGYNVQVNSLVYGVETDLAFTTASKTSKYSAVDAQDANYENSNNRLVALGTLRGRLGVAFDRTLVFATGGLAYGKVENNWSANWAHFDGDTYGVSANTNSWRFGWTAGAGVEQALSGGWSAKVEGLYYDLGKAKSSGVDYCTSVITCEDPHVSWNRSTKNSGYLVRVGLNYKLGN